MIQIPHFTPPPDPLATLRFPELFIMKSDGSQVQRLTHNADYDIPIAFSPDGNRILFQRGSGGVFSIGTDGSEFGGVRAGYSPVISPDGRRIASGTRNPRGVSVIRADGGDLRMIHRCPFEFPDGEFVFSQDGSRVAIVECPEVGGRGRIIIVDVETLKTEIVPKVD